MSYKRVSTVIIVIGPVVVLLLVAAWYVWQKVPVSQNWFVFPLTEQNIRQRLGDRCEVDDSCGSLVGVDCGYPGDKYYFVHRDTGAVVCTLGGFLRITEGPWCPAGDRACQWQQRLDSWVERVIAARECPPRQQWECAVSPGKRLINTKVRAERGILQK